MQSEQIGGHRPELFKGQKGAILDLLLQHRGQWIPAYVLAGRALQYNARVKELRDAGFHVENRTKRIGRQVPGEFRLVSSPDDADARRLLAEPKAPSPSPVQPRVEAPEDHAVLLFADARGCADG